jgi:pimeloyl-ACP methyl ester carboxylesterase
MKLLWLLIFFGSLRTVIAQVPIDTTESIVIGGIKQFIRIQGKNKSLPLLLFLHGGPGGSVMGYANKFTNKLQEHFVIVQWDQRETGRTLQLNPSPVPLTLSLFEDDTYELVTALLNQFKRNKLYLVGHSWGTALGFNVAHKHPELLYAYTAIGPMINQLESERIVLTMMKDKAGLSGNKMQVEELATVRIPFENAEQLFYHRKWLGEFSKRKPNLSKDYVENWSATWLTVFNEASEVNLVESLPEVHCPVYIFAGRKDYQTNSQIAEDYFRKLKAPKKGFYWFEFSGHSIPSSEPRRMQEILISEILRDTFVE